MVNNVLRGMGTDSYKTYGGNHFIMYANTKSLCSTPKTQYYCTSIIFQLKNKEKRWIFKLCYLYLVLHT